MLFHTIFLALALWAYSAQSCPTDVSAACLCLDQQDGVLINCTGLETTQIMQILKSSQAQIGLIKLLILQDIHIPRLSNDFFSGLYIKKLELIRNGLQMIDNGAFNGMANVLQELIITHNNISMIPVGALSSLTSLLRLDFSNNTINELRQEDALPNLPKVKKSKI